MQSDHLFYKQKTLEIENQWMLRVTVKRNHHSGTDTRKKESKIIHYKQLIHGIL